jgi:hypothetical protein
MMRKYLNKLLFFILLIIFLIPIIELGSFTLLQLKQLISFKKHSKLINKDIPYQFTMMKLGEFPHIRTHLDYTSANYTSSNGFRGEQSDVEILLNNYLYYEILAEKKFLTAFFGGSTTFGIGATNKGTFPEEYKKLTKENVVNLGLGGNNQEGQIVLLNYFLKQGYKFNKIIFLDGINEDGCFFGQKKSLNDYIVNIRHQNNLNYYTKQLFLEFLPNKFLFIFNNKKNKENEKNEEMFDFCSDQYVKNLIYLDSISKSNLIETYVILQPALEIIKKEKWKNYEKFYDSILKKIHSNRILLTNTKLLDLRNSSKSEYFTDSQHLNDYGNAFLASEFIKHIR